MANKDIIKKVGMPTVHGNHETEVWGSGGGEPGAKAGAFSVTARVLQGSLAGRPCVGGRGPG